MREMRSGTADAQSAFKLFEGLLDTIRALLQVYDVTTYGQKHMEVRNLQILEKIGAKIGGALSRKELLEAVEQVEAMSRDDKTFSITVSAEEHGILKKAMRLQLRSVRKVPKLARIQLVVTLAASVESYISDMFRIIFRTKPNTLKSKKSTLKDEELVEALRSGSAMDALIEARVRNIMYGSAVEWFEILNNDLGFSVHETYEIEVLFLVRNCLLHNSGNISRELRDSKKGRYRSIGASINITERDITRYTEAAKTVASAILSDYARKFCASEP